MNQIQIKQGDCLELMKEIPDKSIDMILCDLPYGTTACKWDSVIPFEPLWGGYLRVIKDNGAIVLFGSEPFSTELRHSNLKMYKYDWVWNKKKAGNIFLAKYQPMKIHENIMVFGKGKVNYFPIMIPREKIKKSKNYGTGETMGGNKVKEDKVYTYTEKKSDFYFRIFKCCSKRKSSPNPKASSPTRIFNQNIHQRRRNSAGQLYGFRKHRRCM